MCDLKKKLSDMSKKAKTLAFLPWQVKPLNLYKIFIPDDTDDGITTATLLVEVEPIGSCSGNFRWSLSGKDILSVNLPASDILSIPDAAEFTLSWEIRADDIQLRENGSSSEWHDLEDLLGASQLFASRGKDDDSHEFIGKSKKK